MKNNFFLPIQIFLILEKNNFLFFFSKISKYKNFYFYLENSSNFIFFKIFRNEIFFCNSFLVELSAIDTKNFNQINIFKKKNIMYSVLFNYSTLNHFICFNILKSSKILLNSLDKFFSNSNWLEREVSEMYGIFFNFKKDLRKLLLDYSKNENPLLKDFPCEGNSDVYFNFFDSQINYIQNEVVEL